MKYNFFYLLLSLIINIHNAIHVRYNMICSKPTIIIYGITCSLLNNKNLIIILPLTFLTITLTFIIIILLISCIRICINLDIYYAPFDTRYESYWVIYPLKSLINIAHIANYIACFFTILVEYSDYYIYPLEIGIIVIGLIYQNIFNNRQRYNNVI